MSRLRLISLLAVLVAALALSACGDEGSSGGDPRETIDSATLEGIESGKVDLTLSVDAPGKEGGDLDVAISGPFQGGSQGELPQLDFDATVKGSVGGEEVDFEGGLVLLPGTAYLDYEGTEYEVDSTSYGVIEPILDPAAEGQTGEVRCEEAVGELPISSFFENLRGGEGVDVEGTDTTKVSGDLDVPGALETLLDLAEEPACKAQLSAVGELPSRKEAEEAQDEVEAGVKSSQIDVYVGDDGIVRQISAALELEPRQRSGGGPQRASVDFELKLSEVNEEQEIAAPRKPKPLGDLFLKLGINPLELLELLQSGGVSEIIEGIGSAATGGDSGAADQRRYLKCLSEASSPVDLQRCTRLAS